MVSDNEKLLIKIFNEVTEKEKKREFNLELELAEVIIKFTDLQLQIIDLKKTLDEIEETAIISLNTIQKLVDKIKNEKN